jgi:hypothetical protein
MVIGRHRCKVELLVNLLKGAATRRLLEEGLHPFGDRRTAEGRVPSCWARGRWKVFLDSGAAIHRAIRYVEENPLKEGKQRQRWSLVSAFDPAALGLPPTRRPEGGR